MVIFVISSPKLAGCTHRFSESQTSVVQRYKIVCWACI